MIHFLAVEITHLTINVPALKFETGNAHVYFYTNSSLCGFNKRLAERGLPAFGGGDLPIVLLVWAFHWTEKKDEKNFSNLCYLYINSEYTSYLAGALAMLS